MNNFFERLTFEELEEFLHANGVYVRENPLAQTLAIVGNLSYISKPLAILTRESRLLLSDLPSQLHQHDEPGGFLTEGLITDGLLTKELHIEGYTAQDLYDILIQDAGWLLNKVQENEPSLYITITDTILIAMIHPTISDDTKFSRNDIYSMSKLEILDITRRLGLPIDRDFDVLRHNLMTVIRLNGVETGFDLPYVLNQISTAVQFLDFYDLEAFMDAYPSLHGYSFQRRIWSKLAKRDFGIHDDKFFKTYYSPYQRYCELAYREKHAILPGLFQTRFSAPWRYSDVIGLGFDSIECFRHALRIRYEPTHLIYIDLARQEKLDSLYTDIDPILSIAIKAVEDGSLHLLNSAINAHDILLLNINKSYQPASLHELNESNEPAKKKNKSLANVILDNKKSEWDSSALINYWKSCEHLEKEYKLADPGFNIASSISNLILNELKVAAARGFYHTIERFIEATINTPRMYPFYQTMVKQIYPVNAYHGMAHERNNAINIDSYGMLLVMPIMLGCISSYEGQVTGNIKLGLGNLPINKTDEERRSFIVHVLNIVQPWNHEQFFHDAFLLGHGTILLEALQLTYDNNLPLCRSEILGITLKAFNNDLNLVRHILIRVSAKYADHDIILHYLNVPGLTYFNYLFNSNFLSQPMINGQTFDTLYPNDRVEYLVGLFQSIRQDRRDKITKLFTAEPMFFIGSGYRTILIRLLVDGNPFLHYPGSLINPANSINHVNNVNPTNSINPISYVINDGNNNHVISDEKNRWDEDTKYVFSILTEASNLMFVPDDLCDVIFYKHYLIADHILNLTRLPTEDINNIPGIIRWENDPCSPIADLIELLHHTYSSISYKTQQNRGLLLFDLIGYGNEFYVVNHNNEPPDVRKESFIHSINEDLPRIASRALRINDMEDLTYILNIQDQDWFDLEWFTERFTLYSLSELHHKLTDPRNIIGWLYAIKNNLFSGVGQQFGLYANIIIEGGLPAVRAGTGMIRDIKIVDRVRSQTYNHIGTLNNIESGNSIIRPFYTYIVNLSVDALSFTSINKITIEDFRYLFSSICYNILHAYDVDLVYSILPPAITYISVKGASVIIEFANILNSIEIADFMISIYTDPKHFHPDSFIDFTASFATKLYHASLNNCFDIFSYLLKYVNTIQQIKSYARSFILAGPPVSSFYPVSKYNNVLLLLISEYLTPLSYFHVIEEASGGLPYLAKQDAQLAKFLSKLSYPPQPHQIFIIENILQHYSSSTH